MEILIFRHGPAGDREAWRRRGRADEKRPLTGAGKVKTAKAARGLAALIDHLDVIAASPLTRAAQTAEILHTRFPKAAPLTLLELSPSSDPKAAAVRLLSLKGRRVAAVGHEPQLSGLLAALLGAEFSLELKKAGACLIECNHLGRGKLRWLLAPKHLRSL